MSDKPKTGTREWSDSSVNCCQGCAHGCIYCYARSVALQYKRIATGADWTTERINAKAVSKGYRKLKGIVMFPTTHDITKQTLGPCIQVLTKLLKSGNDVLIVSKPDPDIFTTVRCELEEWKAQVLFRFSIGTLDAERSVFWEPGAPKPADRLSALTEAYLSGWKTSVSMEPLLTPWTAERMVQTMAPYVTDKIWIGILNKPWRRCKWALKTPGVAGYNDFLHANIEEVERWQTDEKIMGIYAMLKDNPKVAWKDTYKEVLRRRGVAV